MFSVAQGKSVAKLADELGWTVKAVMWAEKKALEKLRQYLEPLGFSEFFKP